MSTLLKCENVSLGYEGTVVTEGLNFTVESGDYLFILGENGSGKSTLIKALLGLKPQLSGNIDFVGEVRKNEIGYLPQQTLVQRDFPASVREIVQSGCVNRCGIRPFYNKEEKKLAKDMMERLEITHLAKRCYRELSGGQQQRVSIARGLAVDPDIIFMDEPFGALDAITRMKLQEDILKISREEKKTVIFVTHDIEEAVFLADRIVVMMADPGRIKSVVKVPLSTHRDRTGEDFLYVRDKICELFNLKSESYIEYYI